MGNQDGNKTLTISEMLRGDAPTFFMEAHNGLSAKIVEEAGFKAIWASGLTISASYAVRDANEISWTQVLGVVESIVDVVRIPVLVDGDTGFGDFNNVRRLVRKLCVIGAAGVCIEDKRFPKANSFAPKTHELEDPRVFAGKIKAAKDAQRNDDFIVVARVESLIAGSPMEEALARADLYAAAGADAIFIHSKRADAREIIEFMRRSAPGIPVIVAPTTYFSTPVSELCGAGIKGIIWANHSLRASVAAIKDAVQKIALLSSVSTVEPDIVSIKELFRLVNQDELHEAAERYSTFK